MRYSVMFHIYPKIMITTFKQFYYDALSYLQCFFTNYVINYDAIYLHLFFFIGIAECCVALRRFWICSVMSMSILWELWWTDLSSSGANLCTKSSWTVVACTGLTCISENESWVWYRALLDLPLSVFVCYIYIKYAILYLILYSRYYKKGLRCSLRLEEFSI